MGRLSPIDGIAPEDLGIPDLLQYIKTDHIEEVILATSSTVEGMQRLTLLKIILVM